MKPPPLLLGAALLFWGWQTGFFAVGALMAVALESARFIKARWEFSDDDFSRIWTVCTLLFLGAAIYAFTDNGGPSRFNNYIQNPSASTQTSASVVTARTASAILRWLPMILFPFIVAQVYSSREEIPLATISLLLRRRWKKAGKLPLPAMRGRNIAYGFFAVCLFAASVHANENNSYFWGLSALLTWALWLQRTRQFSLMTWTGTLALVFALGYFGQDGLGRLQSYLQNLDPDFLSRFASRRGSNPNQTQTSLGRIGLVKTSPKIVIRLELKDGSEPPTYLHEASYRNFMSSKWKAGSAGGNFETITETPRNSRIWPLLPAKKNPAKVRITCYLDGHSNEDPTARVGLLPLPSGCHRLEDLQAFTLRKNGLGAVRAEGFGLAMFDALYGPGSTIDAPFDPSEILSNAVPLPGSVVASESRDNNSPNETRSNANPDLEVPVAERAALTNVIAELGVTGKSPEQKLRAIKNYFENRFTYSTWQKLSPSKSSRTPLSQFLLESRSGHCEYFATATVLLLRELGIPARYAVGYAVHEASGNGYVVRLSDAHAWCLVWDENARVWRDFDTTPPSWVAEELKQSSPFRKLSDLWSWIELQFSKFRWGQSNLRPYLLMTLVPALLLLVYQVFFRGKRLRRPGKKPAEAPAVWPGLDSEFYLVERKLAEQGFVRRPDEPVSHWLTRVLADPACAETAVPARELLRLHYRYRFDPKSLNDSEREDLRKKAKLALAKAEEGKVRSSN